MNISKIVKNYVNNCKEREPILVNSVIVPNKYKNARNTAFYRLRVDNKIKFYRKGIYYKPKNTPFGELGIDKQELIRKLYIEQDDTIIGYLTGHVLWNKWGITTQVPNKTWIATNSVRKDKELIDIRIKLFKPKVTITKGNYKILQLLDMIDQVGNIQDINYNAYIEALISRFNNMDDYSINYTLNIARRYNTSVIDKIEALIELRFSNRLNHKQLVKKIFNFK